MCGRYTHFFSWAELHFLISQFVPLLMPDEPPGESYNFAPTQRGWVIAARAGAGSEAVERMRWGLLPFWSKTARTAYSTINARVEDASRAPSYREPWKQRRCVVPASGYYEWPLLADGKSKQPYYIRDAAGPILLFGGLWDRWQGPEGTVIETYTIVTREPQGEVATLHDRMPLILPPSLVRDWIEGSANDAAAIVHAAPEPTLRFHPVGKAVGNVRNQGETLIEPVAALAPPLESSG